MKRVLLILLILAGALALILAGVAVLFGVARWATKGRVPSTTVLEANLEVEFIEDVPDDPVASAMYRGAPRVRDFVEALERAGEDNRVQGLIARIGAGGYGMAVAQEIRDAVLAFRNTGKFAVAFSETFGEVGPGNTGYYVATAFDEIWLQPSGDLNLTGFIAEVPFLRGALEKLGIEPHMDHRYEYKNAKNIFTDREMDTHFEEASGAVMRSQFGQLVRGIAEGRQMSEQQVIERIDFGPHLASEATETGLVDGLAYRDEIYSQAKERAGDGAELLYFGEYLKRAGRPHKKGETIALIYGVGAVQRGDSGFDPIFGSPSMGSDTVAGAFRSAIEDDDVVAILFRVDSPGGSAVASDAIWRETVRADEAGKPVIVSMGNVAASGGYWVSMDAHRIVAQPGTVTASIGVVGGKFITTGFWDWLGINYDDLQTSRLSTMYSSSYDYSDAGWERFQAWLDRIYTEFTEKVSEGRDLPLERVREIAKGRVWTGEDALGLGLVDELGGFPAALRLAREAAGLEPDADIRLKKFPPEKTFFEKLTAETPPNSDPAAASAAMLQLLRELQPAARQVRQVTLPPGARGPVFAPAAPEAR